MIATLIGMSLIAQVASSWLVIWKQPSPSIAHTVASGLPTLAPIAAGTAKPMVPRPPELIQVLRVLVADEVRGPHLVLARRPRRRCASGPAIAPSRSMTYCGASVPSSGAS